MHVQVELLDARGALLDQSSETGNKLVDISLPAAGVYLLAVRDPYGQSLGPYTVCLQRMNRPVNAIPAPFGVTHSGNISVRGEFVTYTWSGSAGDHVLVRVGEVPGSEVYPRMYLYDPDGVPLQNPIGYVDWTNHVPLVLPKTGEYTAACLGGYFQGAFGFSVQRLNGPGNDVAAEFGSNHTIPLTRAAEIATFSWTADAGDAVLLSFGNVASDDSDFRAELYDRTASWSRRRLYYVRPSRWTADLEKSGRYSLLVYDWSTRSASYSLYLQRLNNPANVTGLTFGETRSASVAAAGSTATLGWTGNAGDSLAFSAVASPSGTLKLDVEIYDPDGRLLGRTYSSAASFNSTLLLPRTGRYAALVTGSSGGTGPFAVSVQRAPAPGSAVPLSYGQSVQESLSQPGRMRSYSWSGRTGDVVTIRVTPDSAQASALKMDVFDPAGISLADFALAKGSEGVYWAHLPRSGPYVLVVSDTEGSGAGSYTVTASCNGCQPAQAAPCSELHFPFFDPAFPGYQGFAVCDLAATAATLSFTAYDVGGAVLAQKEKVLAPGTQVAFLPHELFGDVLAGKSGHVTVTSDTPNQKGFYLMFNAESTFMDGSGSLAPGPYRSILTESAGSGAAGAISLHNMSGFQGYPEFELVGGDGTVREKKKIRLPALGSWSGRLDELFTTGKVEPGCYIRCSQCNGIDALETLRGADSLAVHKAIFQDRATAVLYASQVAMGGGYYTRLSLVNPIYWERPVTITLYDEQGRPHREAAANPITRTVPAGGKIVVDVAEAFGIADAGTVQTGWLRLDWEVGSIWGSTNMGDAGRGSATSLPLTGVGVKEAVIPHVAQNGTYFTGIAMLNFTKQPAAVTMRVYTSGGALAGEASMRLGPGDMCGSAPTRI